MYIIEKDYFKRPLDIKITRLLIFVSHLLIFKEDKANKILVLELERPKCFEVEGSLSREEQGCSV